MEKIIVIAIALCALGCRTETNTNNSTNQQSCGDQFAEGDEICDGLDLAGQTCESQGYSGGTLACASTCLRFVTSGCTAPECGNNAIDDGEECDGTELNGASCETVLTGTSGTLACGDCAFDTRGCHADPLKIYQSGTRMKMRIGTSPDGSRDFQGWYDDDLALNCKFRRMVDGISRCIPELTASTKMMFVDPACSVRLAVFPSEDNALGNGTRISMEMSSGVYGVFSISSARTTQPYLNEWGTCIQVTNNAFERNDLYVVNALEKSTFQAQADSFE